MVLMTMTLIYIITAIPFALAVLILTRLATRALTRNATPAKVAYTRICMAAVGSALNIAYLTVYLIATVSLQ